MSLNAKPPDLTIPEAMARAQAHWNAGQADQAEMFCQRVLAAWPGHADALHLLGLMAHAYGNIDLAITHLRQACMAPRAPALYSANLAEMCRQRGLLAEAEQAGRRATQMEPTHAGAWNNLGIILQESGQFAESKHCLERVLTLQPHNAQAMNNLGNTCKHLGLNQEAERYWRRALKLQPNYPEPHSNLANLLSAQGAYDKAAEHAKTAIELNPRFADAYINLAGVEIARQRYPDALRWLDALMAFAPEHPVGLAARALALRKLERLDEALLAASQALAAAPNNAEAHNAHGMVLQAMGDGAAALAAYNRAASLPGTATEQAMINRAILLMEIGEKPSAEAAFTELTAAFPNSASAWFNQADLKKFTPDDPAILAMENLLASAGEHADNDKMLLHFALGKAYLDTGEADLAFKHLNTGNAMKRATFTYDPVSTSHWLRSIPQAFPTEILKKPAALEGAQRAVFVFGMPRSGTTLVEQILSSHPGVYGGGELGFMQNIIDKLGNFPASVAKLSPEQLHAIGQEYLAAIAPLGSPAQMVVDKMPINFVYAGFIRLILPQAHIINCRRDAADTCLSCYTKLFSAEQLFSYNLAELGTFHSDYQYISAYWHKTLAPNFYLEAEYEKIIADTELQARRMLKFLDLNWDPACLEIYNNKRIIRTASVNQVRQKIYKTAAGRARQYTTHLQPLLDALDYKPA